MQGLIWLVACITQVVVSEHYELQSSKVCFGAKGNQYGNFKVSTSGVLESIKLVHLSGTVHCTHASTSISYFGCAGDTLNTIITDANNAILFPETSIVNWYGAYKIKGFTANSNDLILKNKVTEPYVEKGDQLRIWYGEDLKNYYEYDNGGRSCVEVLAKIRPAEFKLQRKNVCFSAIGDNPGVFSVKQSGTLTNIKLVWKSGKVDCVWGGSVGSHWGCYSDKLAVVVASADKKVIFPKPNIDGWVTHYKRPKYNVNSETLILDNPVYNPIVKAGQKFGIWYGEDLFNHWEGDNGGRTCADVYAAVIPRKFVLQANNICFGTQGSTYAKFYASTSGRLESINLKYRGGYVTCYDKWSTKHSHWGCGGNALTTIITNSHDKVIYPARYKSGTGEYTLPGYSSQSNEIVLNNPHKVTKVKEGQELRIWFGEDLFNHWEGDNGKSKTCVDVHAIIVSPYSKRCYGQDNGCCTKDNPCDEGEGDCDSDAECAEGLTCGNSNCPWGDKDDCCTAPAQDFVLGISSASATRRR